MRNLIDNKGPGFLLKDIKELLKGSKEKTHLDIFLFCAHFILTYEE